MYFWKINNLKANLIERPATEREALPYLISLWALWTVSLYMGLPTDFGLQFYVNFFVAITGTIFGTWWLYKLNDKSGNNYFLQRYIMLDWVVTIRFFVIFAIPLIVLYELLSELGLGSLDTGATSWLDVVMNLVTYPTYFWYFGKHLTEVAQKATYQ